MAIRQSAARAALFAAVLALGGCGDGRAGDASETTVAAERPELGLFTSLPLYWGENEDPAALLGTAAPGPVRARLEQDWRLVPLDTLDPARLAGLSRLLLAQPRPLAPQENVALDAWVAGGGRLVLFADPLLTAHTAYHLGDKRRPQDIALLSPILARWGLELRFDEDQPAGVRIIDAGAEALPVEMAGSFLPRSGGRADARCALRADSAIADCRIGKGRALLVADAALLDAEAEGTPTRLERLGALLLSALGG